MKKKSDKKFLKDLGKRIRELRKDQEISQDQLAFEVRIRREQVIRIEHGEQSTSISILRKMSDALNMKLKELLDFEY